MTENEHIDKVKQLAAKKELPILNETEFLTFQLDKSDELEIDEDDIVAYIPITFDANKAFGLDVCEDTSNDDIYLTAEWCLGDASTLDLDIFKIFMVAYLLNNCFFIKLTVWRAMTDTRFMKKTCIS